MTAPRRSAPEPISAGDAEDAALVARAVAGDRAAFRALYDRHRPAAHRLARAFATLDPDDAEDVVQDAFVRAFGSIAKLAQPGRFGAWLLTIARNRALSRLDRRKAAARLTEDLSREAGVLAEDVAVMPELDAEAEHEVVRRIVAAMPEGAEKETVSLFYIEGQLSAREIAARLGVGKSAITMRLERFRAKVKRRLLAEVARLRGEGS
ncbi:MAG TPA: RNA polymerase sigma factor [Anaeromyxobacter sp.]